MPSPSTPNPTGPTSEASTEREFFSSNGESAVPPLSSVPAAESPAHLETAPEPTDDVTAAEMPILPEPEGGLAGAAVVGDDPTEAVLAPHVPGAAGEAAIAASLAADSPAVRRHNFIVFALYQIVVRTGWIFKTESIIMPAMLDSIDPTKGTLRAWLPLLSRFGQSIPPLFYAPWLRRVPFKKISVFTTTLGMAATLMALGALWLWAGQTTGEGAWVWMPTAFLLLYALFFSFVGTNQLAFSTLQGKLIHVTSRGRQMLVANLVGVTIAVAFALTLLPLWLNSTKADYFLILGFAGLCMAVAAFSALWLREAPEAHGDAGGSRNYLKRALNDARTLLRTDRNYRRLSLVAMLFGASMLLFPHYQAYAFGEFGMNLRSMITWVIVQNIGTALFSVLLGPLADRRGNRLSLQLLLFGLMLIPLLAMLLVHLGEAGRNLYWIVFLLIGMMPVTIRSLHNYTLEISEPADHPRYLGTLSLAAAAPLLLSPPLGLLLTYAGFEIVFSLIAAVLGVGWLVTFTLQEPRNGGM